MNVTIDNFIGIFEDAYSKEYCDSVIQFFEHMNQAGLTLNRQQQAPDVYKLTKDDLQLYASSDECSLKHCSEYINAFNDVFWGKAYSNYANKFAILKDYSPHTNYAFKIQKTEIGQGYHVWHTENGNRDLCSRILAWTLYLNDVEEGGETEFLYYPKRIKPKAGTLIIWPANFTHTHRGNPPISNTKYIITGWVEI
jgi:hypothetical protein